MSKSPTPPVAPTGPAGRPRALIFLVAGLAVLAAFLVVTKVVMKPASPSTPATPATTVPVTHGIVRTVAGAATAAGKKLDASTGAADPTKPATTSVTVQAGTAATTTPAASDGPTPNTVRNPFQP